MRPGLVSIIIPVYNRPALLAEAVASALAQTYRPIEVIVVDDGSTDDTAAVAQALAAADADLVRYARVPHGGVALAMNEGLRLASGEFIQILDSDDLLLPEKLSRQVGGLRAHPECGISYGYAREYVLGGPWSGRPARRTGETFDQLFPAILEGKIWPAPSPLFRRSAIDRAGEFVDAAVQPEWELECRLAAKGVRLHHCREFVCDTRNAHHVEGRRKGAIGSAQLDQYVQVLSLIWSHARGITLPPSVSDHFARRVFATARRSAAAGLGAAAQRCLELADESATRRRTRVGIAGYSAMSAALGSKRAGVWTVGVERSRIADAVRAVRRGSRGVSALWLHRARVARQTIAGHSIAQWPVLLKQKWADRESARPVIFPSQSS
jgi:glycosyltransferase involved in cell wall biosynthesis